MLKDSTHRNAGSDTAGWARLTGGGSHVAISSISGDDAECIGQFGPREFIPISSSKALAVKKFTLLVFKLVNTKIDSNI